MYETEREVLCVCVLRHEHGSRGDRGASLRDEGGGSVSDHQSGGDGLLQREESQSRGGPADGRTESAADGETRLHHGLPHEDTKALTANTSTRTSLDARMLVIDVTFSLTVFTFQGQRVLGNISLLCLSSKLL